MDSSIVLPEQTCRRFTLAEIQSETSNFDERLVIGRGGFGKVYKCRKGNPIAVKRLHDMSDQGADQFEAEVKVLSKLRHGNLVSLIGYCNEENEMVLVYDFMPNGTLKHHLHEADSSLSWLQRLKICVGTARGLDYLHTGTSTQHGVIHRDVKTSNILLDGNFAAKISDFGLAKVSSIDQTQTCLSTVVKGTFGYMDPCYFYTGKLTRKSDVYAFGVVLFEVLSGRKAVDSTLDEEQWSLAVWAQDQIKEGKLNQIIDSRLGGQISKKCLKEFASIASQCLSTKPKQRPTMAEVVVKLQSIFSQEVESANSVVNEGRFIYMVRSFFTAKDEAMPDGAVGGKSVMPDVVDTSKSDSISLHIQLLKDLSLKTFTYAELVSVTNNFNDEVYSPTFDESIYKGWVDQSTYIPTERGDGLVMYVRKLKANLKLEEFNHHNLKLKESNHHNLTRLLGYCLNKNKLFLVYELVHGTSLDKCLYREPGTTSLSWVARLKIAVGIAERLLFLHQRNDHVCEQFKTNRILVDMDFNVRISHASSPAFRGISFRMDACYASPEWFRYHADQLDSVHEVPPPDAGFIIKSEIYAFGVVLLEMLTGMKVYDVRRPLEKENLVTWATPLLAHEANLGMIVDTQLQHNNHPSVGALKFAQLVSNCLEPLEGCRPPMAEILQILDQCYQEEIKLV